MMDLVEAHDDALAATGEIVAGLDQSQLSLPTPCPEFDVRALLGHLVEGNHRLVAIAHGEPGTSVALTADVPDDWLAFYTSSAAAVADAWRDPALLDETVELPLGEVTGTVALGVHTVETVVHGWDLAKATGQSTEVAPDLCAVAWRNVQSVNDDLRGPGRPFAAAVPVPADATATERLVAWLGRRP